MDELYINSVVQDLVNQLSAANMSLARKAGEIAVLNKRINEYQESLSPQKPEAESPPVTVVDAA